MSEHKYYFRNLDSIRFIAALFVFLQHGFFNAFNLLPIKGTFLGKALSGICNAGAGVSLFFVLSGFLITNNLLTEKKIYNAISIKNFYARRFLRIWPLFFLVLLFTFVFYPVVKDSIGMHTHSNYSWIYHFTFLSNFDIMNVERYHEGFDALSQNITWSISIEEQFYLVWPLIFLAPSRYLLSIISALIMFSIGFRILHFDDPLTLYFHSFSSLIDLAMGALFACAAAKWQAVKSYFENTGTATHAVLFILFFIYLIFDNDIFSFTYGLAVQRVFLTVLAAFLISAQAFTKQDSLFNLQNFKFAAHFGKFTYGMYLLHPIAILIVNITLRVTGLYKESFSILLIQSSVALGITLVISMASFRYIESPFLKLKAYFYTQPPTMVQRPD